MIHRICFDGHFSSTKTLVEKMRRCFQALPHLIYIINNRVQSFKNANNNTIKWPIKISTSNIPPPRIVRKKRNEAFWPATRGHRTARVVKEREKERKKERKTVAPRAWWWWCRRGEGGRFPKEN